MGTSFQNFKEVDIVKPILSLRCMLAATLLLSCATLFFPNASANDTALRRWSDTSGKYKVDARFLAFENGDVRLVKSDGTILLVPLDRLSSSDRNYVRASLRMRHAKRRKKALAEPNPRTNRTGKAASPAETLYGINWHSPDGVHKVARGKPAKPVIWFRVLGALDGFM